MKVSDLIEATRILPTGANSSHIFYHGTKQPFDQFDLSYLTTGNHQSGPGFYFTTNIDSARTYAEGPTGTILACRLTPRKLITNRGIPSERGVSIMIKNAPDLDMSLSNWDEDPQRAKYKAIHAMIEPGDPKETYDRVWADFYMGHEPEWVKWMIRFGYDGSAVPPRTSETVVIIWNPAKIKVLQKISPKSS